MIEHKLYAEDLSQINQLKLPWSNLDGSSILVTGATGLIGSILVDTLILRNEMRKADINIWVLGRNEATLRERFGKYFDKDYFHYILQDVSSKIVINMPIDYIIHAASKGDPYSFATDPVGVMNSNYMGMFQVLELAKEKHSKKVLYISSGEVYGIQSLTNAPDINKSAMGEEDYGYVNILNPRSCYASSKRATETLCASFGYQYGIDVTIARPCHTYGPTMLSSDSRVIGEFILKALQHSNIVMKSQGIQKRSYCYAADTAAALIYILLLGENGEAYNIANKNSIITIKELAELIARIAKTKVVFEIPEETDTKRDSNIVNGVLKSTKLEGLGWIPKYGIVEGIERTMRIYVDRRYL